MSVKVKRLEWESTRYGETEACTPFGFFKVRHEAYQRYRLDAPRATRQSRSMRAMV